MSEVSENSNQKDVLDKEKAMNEKLQMIFRQVKTLFALRYTKQDRNPSEVIPHLYLGSVGAALSKDVLENLNIKYVLTAMDEMKQPFPELIEEYKIIRVKDSKVENISDYFEETNSFIHQALSQNKNILVHCFAGVSRSSTFVIAYLIKHLHKSRDESLALLRQVRPVASPNSNFLLQLKKYEEHIKTLIPSLPNSTESSNTQNESIPDISLNPSPILESDIIEPNHTKHIENTQNNVKQQVVEEIKLPEHAQMTIQQENKENNESNELQLKKDDQPCQNKQEIECNSIINGTQDKIESSSNDQTSQNQTLNENNQGMECDSIIHAAQDKLEPQSKINDQTSQNQTSNENNQIQYDSIIHADLNKLESPSEINDQTYENQTLKETKQGTECDSIIHVTQDKHEPSSVINDQTNENKQGLECDQIIHVINDKLEPASEINDQTSEDNILNKNKQGIECDTSINVQNQ